MWETDLWNAKHSRAKYDEPLLCLQSMQQRQALQSHEGWRWPFWIQPLNVCLYMYTQEAGLEMNPSNLVIHIESAMTLRRTVM